MFGSKNNGLSDGPGSRRREEIWAGTATSFTSVIIGLVDPPRRSAGFFFPRSTRRRTGGPEADAAPKSDPRGRLRRLRFGHVAELEPRAPGVRVAAALIASSLGLLVFYFMLASERRKVEAEALTLPLAIMGEYEDNLPPSRVTINVLEDGLVRIGGITYVDSDDISRLEKFLAARAECHMVIIDPPISDLPVTIRADAEVEYQYVQRVLRACMRAHIWNVSFGVAPTQSIPF